jgi:hypothetical protein
VRQDRVYRATRDIVGVLEKNARGDVLAAMATEIEDDLESIGALLGELTEEQLNKARIQDVLAHLLDHVIGSVLEFDQGLPTQSKGEGDQLLEYLEDFMHVTELKFNRKTSAMRSEKLRLVLENFWDDAEGSEDEDEDEEGEGEEREEPRERKPRPKPESKPKPEPYGSPEKEQKAPPEQAEVELEAEEED